MSPAVAAVTGATGYLGQFVCADLLQRGYRVRGLRRSKSTVDLPGVEWVEGSMQASASIAQLTDGAQYLVHCALEHVPGRYRGGEGDNPLAFWQHNFMATVALLESCLANRVQRCVLISSRAALDGHHGQAPLPDSAPAKPSSHYGALKAAEEMLAHNYSASTSLQVRCLRATGIFGLVQPMARSKWFELVGQVLSATPGQLQHLSPRQATEVHGADAAAAVHLLLQQPPQHNAAITFNCSDLRISQQQLAGQVVALANLPGGEPVSASTLAEPPAGPLLDCSGLHQLGWQPTGAKRLNEVLMQLIAAQRSAANQGNKLT